MVGGDHDYAVRLGDHRKQARQLEVQALHGGDHGLEVAGVADHVAVGVVDAQVAVLARLDGFDQGVGDLGALHPRALLEGHHVRRDLGVGLELVVELARLVAVPEVGDVAVLLGLGDGELGDAVLREVLAEGAADRRRHHQEAGRNLEVAVVLHHAGVGDLREADTVEDLEVGFGEGAGDLDGAVAAEVEVDHGVTVDDGADGLATLCDHESGQVLVDDAGLFGAEDLDGLLGRSEAAALGQHVAFPAALDHAPVGLVAVHGDAHAATAGSDGGVKIGAIEAGEEGFEGLDVVQGGGLAHVAAVDERMHAHGLDAFLLGLGDHGLEVVNVAVHVAVGEEAQEVDGAALLACSHHVLPALSVPHGAGVDGLGDELGPLGEDAAGADGVVAHFGVAHVVIGRHADGGAVGAQLNPGLGGHQGLQGRRAGRCHSVPFDAAGKPYAVQDDGDHRTLGGRETSGFIELQIGHICSF